VRASIEKALLHEAALAQAVTTGETQLAKLNAGEKINISWGAVRSLSRQTATNLPPEGKKAIFAAATQALPAHVGARTPGGYVVYRIEKLKPFDASTAENDQATDAAKQSSALRQQYEQVVTQQEVLGWLSSLRERYPVKINAAALEKK
jgi:peptidyl-prolyl cis-trans isomerase D